LFRSGIGPTDVLTTISTNSTDSKSMIAQSQWINVPVGYNLHNQDNTDLVGSYPNITHYDFYGAYDDPIPADAQKYLNQRAGQLAESAPNCNTVFFQNVMGSDGRIKQFQWTARKESSLGIPGNNTFVTALYITAGATSRGRVTIQSNLETVVSTAPYLTTQADYDAKVWAIQQWINAASKYPGLTLNAPVPGQNASDYLANYLGGHDSNHWMGTCKLGLDDGTKGGTSVVDINAQVYGTINLFVVDASIFPGPTSANPSAYIMTAAEAASARILALALNSKAGANNPSSSSSKSSTTMSKTTTTSSKTTTTSSKLTTTSSKVTTTTSKLTTTTSKTTTTTTTTKTTTTSGPQQTHYGQCAGNGWTGPTVCQSPYNCQYSNPYYSQCL